MVTTTTQPTWTLEQAENAIAALRGQVDALSEILQLTNGPVPNTPPSGTVDLFAAGGQPNYINAAGLQMGLVGCQNATFPQNTITAASLQTIASVTYPANDAEVGAAYELDVNGYGTWGSTQQSLQFAVSLGGVQMAGVVIGSTFFAASQTFRWKCRARVYCHTTGSSGTWTSEVDGSISAFGNNLLPTANSGQDTSAFTSCESTTTSTVDTTASQTFALQVAWGATAGSPTITSAVKLFKRIA